MPQIKSAYFLALVFLFSCFAATGQEEAIPYANVLQTEHGFLVHGFIKRNFTIRFYNENLELVSTISEPVKGNTNRVEKIEQIDQNYLFLTNNARLVVDSKGKKVAFRDWAAEKKKKEYGELLDESKDYYDPPMYNDSKCVEEFLAFHTQQTTLKVYSEYNDGQVKNTIRCFDMRNDPLFLKGESAWEVEIDADKLEYYRWFQLGKDHLYLYVLHHNPITGVYRPMLYKVNIEKQKIDFFYSLDLGNQEIIALSNVFLDSDKNLVVIAHYKDKKINPSVYLGPENEGPKGWFIVRLDNQGKPLKLQKHLYEKHEIKKFLEEPFVGTFTNYRMINMSAVYPQKDGKIHILGENLFIRMKVPILGGMPDMFDFICYTYGVTHFQLDKDLNLISKNYFHHFFTSELFPKGNGWEIQHSAVYSNIHDLYTNTRTHHKYRGIPFFKLSVVDHYFDEENKTIIFCQQEDEYQNQFCYKIDLERNGSAKSGPFKKYVGDNWRVFMLSPSTGVQFNSNDKNYTLERISF